MDIYEMTVVGYLVFAATLVGICLCKSCVTDDRCKCTFDDGSGTVDLSAAAKRDGYPQFWDMPSSNDTFLYSYNPCVGFSEGSCASVAVCQFDSQKFGYSDLGTEDSTTFSFNGLNVVAEYTSADGSRITHVTLVCDPSATKPHIDVQGESPPNNYNMAMTSSAACPVGGSSLGGYLSAGSIFIIVLFSLVLIYLAGGIVINKIRRGSKGLDLIPNRELWVSLTDLIKDGCGFVIAVVFRRKGYGIM